MVPHPHAPSRQRQRAFSLIELMVVLVLIGVMMGTAVYMMGKGTTANFEVRSASRKLAGLMEQAFRFPETTGLDAWLDYDIDEQRIDLWVQRRPDDDEDIQDYAEEDEDELLVHRGTMRIGDPEEPESSKVWLVEVQTYDGKRYDSGIVRIHFSRTGSSTGHVVKIETNQLNEGQSEPTRYSVEINPLSGIAKVYDSFKEVEEPIKD